MTAARLIIWRHGETDWNVTGRFQGHHDIPLNAVGEQQARTAAPFLAEWGPTSIVSSDLSRAKGTAQALAELTDLPITLDERLREINVGDWVGRTIQEIVDEDPEIGERMRNGEDVRRSATGETGAEMGERIAAALGDIAEEAEDGETVVVVTHGMAARIGTVSFVGGSFFDTRLFGGIRNCAWIVMDPGRDGVWRIRQYNVHV
ncbi:histidine phosphatase family protein [Raineyella fluvialis]|uniref:Histidine phosphatase family protein n=1 Tax=Raineyella fluvialis TaxID=2662261 RepID=A0A5Q2FGN4_9ACTN|nr:histidine phosphatase family protein [Raineyella fluvialis]QGF24273.1 histidine phosphatase family protein [Raineyella fluvialis]